MRASMSVTPEYAPRVLGETVRVTDAPTASQVYTWEPSNPAIAARYGLRPEDILRFDTNTSPLAARWRPRRCGSIRPNAQRISRLLIRRADGGGGELRRGRAVRSDRRGGCR